MSRVTASRVSRRLVHKAVLISSLVFSTWVGAQSQAPYIEAVSPYIKMIDPAVIVGYNEQTVVRNLFEPLTVHHPERGSMPAQAVKWEVSEDGLVYTFHLRDDLRWSDGKQVVADDFVETLRRIVNPDTGSKLVPSISSISNARRVHAGLGEIDELGARALSDSTLEITLSAPNSLFLSRTSSSAFMPTPRHVTAILGDAWANGSSVVSNGAFSLFQRTEELLELRRNPYYHSEIAANFDRVIIEFSNSTPEVLSRFHAGDIDVILSAEYRYIRAVNLMNSVQVIPHSVQGIRFLSFNLTHPALGDLAVRKALAGSIDVDQIVGRLRLPYLTPAHSFIPALALPRGREGLASVEVDETIDEALQRLGLEQPLHLRGTTPLERSDPQLSAAIKAAWNSLGVEVEIEALPMHEWIDSYFNGTADFLINSWYSKNANIEYMHFFTKPVRKYSLGWQNDDFSELYKEACLSLDSAGRSFEYQIQLEGILKEELPAIPLYHHRPFHAVSGRVIVDRDAVMPASFQSMRLRKFEESSALLVE